MNDTPTFIFEDENLLAIHKPPHIPFHCEETAPGIVQIVRNLYGSQGLFPVHRLDKMTSGLMLFAKNPRTNSDLSKLFAARRVEKYYLALSTTKPNKKQGVIKGSMVKARRGCYKLTRSNDDLAITRFKARSILVDINKVEKSYWLFVVKPETGKTHQIRVALKSLGAPILGDARYAGDTASRGYLHAYCLRFTLGDKKYQLFDKVFEGEEASLTKFDQSLDLLKEPHLLTWGKQAYKSD